jgi:hypothetical protein
MKAMFTKILLMAMLCLGFSNYLQAQYIVNGKEIDTTFNTKMNLVFGGLDKSRVPFGLLKDYAMEFTSLKAYDGTNMADSTLLNKGLLYSIYNTLLTARVTAAAFATLPNSIVVDSVWARYRYPGQVALCGLFYQYAYLDETALGSNRITVSNNQYYDKYINGTWQNPYLTGNTIGFAPATETYMGKTFNILLPDSLLLSNNKGIVNHIEIDAADGLGYRSISANIPLPVSYVDTGMKVWNIKLYLNDNSILQSHTRLQVTEDTYAQNYPAPPPSGGLSTMSVSSGRPPNPYPFLYVTSSETFGGKHAYGKITVSLAQGHSGIIKPFIVVEGFDPGIYTKPENPVGEYSFKNFYDDLASSSTLKNLLANNYDIIFLDYDNGTDDIRRNALLVKEVIRWVNTQKAANGSTEKNVVIGQSMGGIVARYALKKMEDGGETHDTRLYINHDGPQQGANVPTGYQFMINHGHDLYVRAGPAAAIYDVVNYIFGSGTNVLSGSLGIKNTPAAKQMIINYINDNDNLDNSAHTAWQSELTNLGYPAQGGIRNIAISNGSECGQIQDLQPGGQMLSVDGDIKPSVWGDLVGMIGLPLAGVLTGQPALLIGVLPGSNKFNMHFKVSAANQYGGNQVYTGNIDYTKRLLWSINITVNLTNKSKDAPTGVLHYENLSGGFYHNAAIKPPADVDGWLHYGITITSPVDFGLIPVASALDLGSSPSALSAPDYMKAYGMNNPPAAPKNTPFVNFITARNGSTPNNERHISFETRNGGWLANELNKTPVLVDCSLSCANQTITGAEHFCGAGTTVQYYIPDIPANANVTWTATGSIFIIGNTIGSHVDISTNTAEGTPGYGTLTAVLHSTCGDVTVFKEISTGIEALPPIDGPATVCAYSLLNIYTINTQAAVGDYHWAMYPGPPDFTPHDGNSLHFYTNYPGDYYLVATVPTACGTEQQSMWISVISDMDCGGGGWSFNAYPNPANNTISISVNESNTKNTNTNTAVNNKLESTSKDFEARIYNAKGKILKAAKNIGKREIKFDTSDIPTGTYYLHIFDEKNIIKKQIIINH